VELLPRASAQPSHATYAAFATGGVKPAGRARRQARWLTAVACGRL